MATENTNPDFTDLPEARTETYFNFEDGYPLPPSWVIVRAHSGGSGNGTFIGKCAGLPRIFGSSRAEVEERVRYEARSDEAQREQRAAPVAAAAAATTAGPAARRRNRAQVAKYVLAALLGAALGLGAAVAFTEPEVVTHTNFKTVTEEVEVTPQSCLTAIELMGEVTTVAGQATRDAFNRDGAALDRRTAEIEELTPDVTMARLACEAAAQPRP